MKKMKSKRYTRRERNKAVTHNNNAIGINRFGAVISRTLNNTKEYTHSACICMCVCGEWIMEKSVL